MGSHIRDRRGSTFDNRMQTLSMALFNVIDADRNGSVDIAEFTKVFSVLDSFMPDGSFLDTNTFASMDTDNDKQVSLKEWMAHMEVLIGALGRREFKRFIDNNLSILYAKEYAIVLDETPKGIRAFVRTLLNNANKKGTSLEHYFEVVDSDTNDRIDRNEFIIHMGRLNVHRDAATAVFNYIDVNKDNSITSNEFIGALRAAGSVAVGDPVLFSLAKFEGGSGNVVSRDGKTMEVEITGGPVDIGQVKTFNIAHLNLDMKTALLSCGGG